MVIKTQQCDFCSYKIFPGHGMLHIDKGGRSFRFIGSKEKSLWHQNIKPQKLTWTQTWRKMHKKGISQTSTRKRTRKTRTTRTRAVGNVAFAALKEKRSQKGEFRKAQRDSALREAKERKRAKAKFARQNRSNRQPTARAAPARNVRRGARR